MTATKRKRPRNAPSRYRAFRSQETRRNLSRIIAKRAKDLGIEKREILAKVVKDAPSQMSRLLTGYHEDFSVERMLYYAIHMGDDVEIVVKHKKGRRLGTVGHISVKDLTR